MVLLFCWCSPMSNHSNLRYRKLVPTECSQQSDSPMTSYKSFPADNCKESEPAETKLTPKSTCGAAQCHPQPTGQKLQVKQLKHAA